MNHSFHVKPDDDNIKNPKFGLKFKALDDTDRPPCNEHPCKVLGFVDEDHPSP